MARTSAAFKLTIAALAAATLACNAVTNLITGPNIDDVTGPRATADALMTRQPTAGAGATRTPRGTTSAPATVTPASSDPAFEPRPEGIPVYTDGEVSDFNGTAELMSYVVEAPYDEVVAFYKEQMRANGWTTLPFGLIETAELSILSYEQTGRTAVLTLNPDLSDRNKTMVLVAVTEN